LKRRILARKAKLARLLADLFSWVGRLWSDMFDFCRYTTIQQAKIALFSGRCPRVSYWLWPIYRRWAVG
jgi:hypothetical protein